MASIKYILALGLAWSVIFEWFYSYGIQKLLLTVTVAALAVVVGLEQRASAQKKERHNAILCAWLYFSAVSCVWRLWQWWLCAVQFDNWQRAITWNIEPLIPPIGYYVIVKLSERKAYIALGAKNVGVCAIAILAALSSQIQYAEYYYYFFGPPTHTVHPQFTAGVLLILLALLIEQIITLKNWNIARSLTVAFTLCAALIVIRTVEININYDLGALFSFCRLRSVAEILLGAAPGSDSYYPWEICRKGAELGRCRIPGLLALTLQYGVLATALFCLLATMSIHKVICSKGTFGKLIAPLCLGLFLAAPGISSPVVILFFFWLLSNSFAKEQSTIISEKKISTPMRAFAALIFAGLAALFSYATYEVWAGNQRRDYQEVLLPKHLVAQLLIAEDLLFFEHHGVDFARLKWVVRDLVKSGVLRRGGSTISMQLVKVRHLSYEKTIMRKGLQIMLAVILEGISSKEKILADYLNEVSFGENISGILRAAEFYFEKSPLELTEEETLKLVLTIEDPSNYNPRHEAMPLSVAERSVTVSNRMLRSGHKLEPYLKMVSFLR